VVWQDQAACAGRHAFNRLVSPLPARLGSVKTFVFTRAKVTTGTCLIQNWGRVGNPDDLPDFLLRPDGLGEI
jgi:hypothetical protein